MKKMVWITKMAPADIDSAGLILQYRMLEMLSTHYQITVISHKEDYGTNPLKKLGIQAIKAKSAEHVVNYVREGGFNIAVFNWWEIAYQYLQKINQYVGKVIINSIDVEFVRKRRANKLGFVEPYDENSELKTYSWADLIWFVTKEDEKAVKLRLPNINSEVIPIPIKMVFRKYYSIDPKSIYFIGNYLHSPNVDAVKILCDEIFPQLPPDIHLYVYGKWPPTELQKRSSDRIHITGIVYDLDKRLKNMGVCAAPLRYGAGLKGKVVEAMSYGIPVVGSSIAFEGLNVTHGINAKIANTSDEFISEIKDLLSDELKRISIGMNGQSFISELSQSALKPVLLKSIEGAV